MEKSTALSRTTPRRSFSILSFVVLIFFYAWLHIAGTENNPVGLTTYYYSYLADAFLDGNLHLAMQPDPLLLGLENPYDPRAREELGKFNAFIPVDFSLYEGKYYLYWGPVPGLLLAAIQFFLPGSPVDDSFLAFVFGIGILFTQSILIITIWDHHFHTLPKWILHISIILAGLTWPIALLRSYSDHARIYQAAIAAGQLFLIGGFLIALNAIANPIISNRPLALAGIFWALAIGSRNLLVVPVSLMCIITTFWIVRMSVGLVTKAIKILCLGMPLLVGGVLLGWYNWARFGSVLETGLFYQLAGINIQGHTTELFSGMNMIQNLYTYLFSAPGFKFEFPFVYMQQLNMNILLPFYTSPKFYYAEPMTGVVYLFPFAVFALVPGIGILSGLFKESTEIQSLERAKFGLRTWVALNLTVSCFASFLLMLFYFWAGMRHLGDFLPFLTILSILGFWHGYQLSAPGSLIRTLYTVGGIVFAGISMIMGTLLAISTAIG